MDDRLTTLEVKIAYIEHQVAQLDAVLRQTIDGLEGLRREVGALLEDRNVASVRGSLEEEVPPHHVPRS